MNALDGMEIGEVRTVNGAEIRFDGIYEFITGENRTFTLVSHFIDAEGADRIGSSFGLAGLIELGVLKGTRS